MDKGWRMFYRYWGKAKTDPEGHLRFHLLPYHCLDVAAVGREILNSRIEFKNNLAKFLDFHPEVLSSWFTFLLAIHDVGKFGDGFQNLRPDLLNRLQGRCSPVHYEERHDTIGFRFCRKGCFGWLPLKIVESSGNGCLDNEQMQDILTSWLSAVQGHHGKPPNLVLKPRPLQFEFPPSVCEDTQAFIREVSSLLFTKDLPCPSGDYSFLNRALARVSWLLAGLTVAADWIGSNERWFPYCEQAMPLKEYWYERAIPQAQVSLAESGLIPCKASPWMGIRKMFPGIELPTPLQKVVEQLELTDYPQLFIIEEVTGGGKTEAALALTQRLMAEGSVDGLYFALPTMATANAMHRRIKDVYLRMFDEGTRPSLVLAHSASRISHALEEKSRMDDHQELGDDIASAECSWWLADSRKKAMLAHVGVGTIDQALLAVMNARHQSMRLFGLFRKVLIVDEVHACDAYVHRLLCTLLKFHAALGGSAILLSATLPQQMRTELLRAFAEGLGLEEALPVNMAYPMLTHLSIGEIKEYTFAPREEMTRKIHLCLLHEGEKVEEGLQSALDAGSCACWVRNTVYDALEAYKVWVRKIGESKVILFHARFALVDRLRIEDEIISWFGPKSTVQQRQGRLVIATQVLEQSLDVDFDAMVSDLAPIDLLVQRAGRLRRHPRDRLGNPISGSDLRPDYPFGVYMPYPDLNAKEDWFGGFFPKAKLVYPHHGQLWLTAKWLSEHPVFSMPDDARRMIEAVYGVNTQDIVPKGLVKATMRAEGEISAMSAQGRLNGLILEKGYVATTEQWNDDVSAPTRLGEPTTTVRLAKWEGERIVPWAEGDPRIAWELSQLTVRRSRIAGDSPNYSTSVLDAARASMSDGGKHCVIIVLSREGNTWFGSAVNARDVTVSVEYDKRTGLQFQEGDST
jgi:CRISPR-associated endonuclease/helicase Cas3